MSGRFEQTIQRAGDAELRVCRCLNRSAHIGAVRELFRGVGFLGDGWIWYALIIVLPLCYGADGWRAAAQMTLAGAAGVAVYRTVKTRTVRERPFVTHDVIHCISVPLDRYSFPSGHTLHAVAFTVVLAAHFPGWAAPMSAFTTMVALSRVVLGLHYPTDVAAGALIGGALGVGVVNLAAAAGG